jgi:pantoate kinase
MWTNSPNKVGKKYLMQGSIKLPELENVMKASEFAVRCGFMPKDNQYSYISFCIKFTTGELLKAMSAMEVPTDAST